MPRLKLNRKLERLLVTPKAIKVIIGGRNSGKSRGIVDILTLKMATEGADIYCLREFQDSIADSVHRVFQTSIEALDLEGWTITADRVMSPNGAVTKYKGAARNPDSIQSAQGYKYSFFEEAHTASQASLDKLLPTILRNPGAECWFAANPQSMNDPFSKRFINPYKKQLDRDGYFEDDLHLIVVINWRDNPWFGEEGEALRKWDYENLSRAKYNWIWEGHFYDEVEGSIIKPEWLEACKDVHKDPRFKAMFKPRGAVIAAFDPSDTGNDSAGFAIRHGSIIETVQEKFTGEIDEKTDWATDLSLEQRVDWFLYDQDGMGAGLKRQVADAFEGTRVEWHGFRGSLSGSGQDNADSTYEPAHNRPGEERTTYAETFKNNRSQYYTELADRCFRTYRMVKDNVVVDVDRLISFNTEGIENWEALQSELCRIPLNERATLIQIMSKPDMARLQISSPNMGDSVMMTMYQPKIRHINSVNTFVQQSQQANNNYDPFSN